MKYIFRLAQIKTRFKYLNYFFSPSTIFSSSKVLISTTKALLSNNGFFLLSLTHLNFYLKDHANTARIDYIHDLNNFIIKNNNSQDEIYGSFEITPLVSIMTGREITSNFIDTNSKTFSTGMFNLDTREKILKNNKTKFILTKILASPEGKILALDNFISFNFLNKYCKPIKNYAIKKDYYSNLLVVWQCEF